MALNSAIVQLSAPDGGLGSALTVGRVPAALRTYLTDTLKLDRLDDLLNFVNKAKWEEELESKLISKAVTAKVILPEDSDLALSRLRSAYDAASRAIRAQSGSMQGVAEDLDKPMSSERISQLDLQWKSAYPGVERLPLLQCSSSLANRIYSQWMSNQPTVAHLEKIKTALADRFLQEKQKVQIGSAVLTLDQTAEQGLAVQTVVQLYLLLRCLCDLWAYIGSDDVQSKEDPTKKVKRMPLDVALGYADRVLVRSCQCPVLESYEWVRKTDWLTRSRMVALMLRGWPAGEALIRAENETVEWNMVPCPVQGYRSISLEEGLEKNVFAQPTSLLEEAARRGQQNSQADGTSPGRSSGSGLGDSKKRSLPPAAPTTDGKKIRTASTMKGGVKLCKAYNDSRRCNNARPGSACQDGLHVCDVIREDTGKVCGEKHPRYQCS